MEGQASQHSGGSGSGEVRDGADRAVVPSPKLPPPPGHRQHDMYIVQFPKDQVYRVPPRENALIAEKLRNPPSAKKRRCCCCFCCCCSSRLLLTIALIIVSIIAIVGMTFAILYFIFNPTGPTFTVTDLAVKNNVQGSNNSPPQYEISLRAKNPNKRLGLEYQKNADVSLMFEDTKVAAGKFPRLKQGRDASTAVKVELAGSNERLPKEMEKSMNDDKSNMSVALGLDMRLGVRITAAGLKTWVMKSNVACKFKVRNLENDTRILSQECDTNFKQY